jgi:hypothetical protein
MNQIDEQFARSRIIRAKSLDWSMAETSKAKRILTRTGGASSLGVRVPVCEEDPDNFANDELIAFRLLAKSYAGLTERQVARLVSGKHLVEICRDDEA